MKEIIEWAYSLSLCSGIPNEATIPVTKETEMTVNETHSGNSI
jgi:hypothetical protein